MCYNVCIKIDEKSINSRNTKPAHRANERNHMNSNEAYEHAMELINQLPPTTYNRPDSLSRRGDTLIARFAYNVKWTKKQAIADWRETMQRLFPTATIEKVTADRKNHVRAYLHFTQ